MWGIALALFLGLARPFLPSACICNIHGSRKARVKKKKCGRPVSIHHVNNVRWTHIWILALPITSISHPLTWWMLLGLPRFLLLFHSCNWKVKTGHLTSTRDHLICTTVNVTSTRVNVTSTRVNVTSTRVNVTSTRNHLTCTRVNVTSKRGHVTHSPQVAGW